MPDGGTIDPRDNSSRVTSLNVKTTSAQRADISRQEPDKDPFATGATIGGSNSPIPTPYSMPLLANVFEKSNTLRQCIDAMVTNVTSFGQRVVSVADGYPTNESEEQRLRAFMHSANVDQSLREVLAKVYFDYEKYGFAFLEVIRNRAGGVSLVKYCPAFYTRLLPKDDNVKEVRLRVDRGDGPVTIVERKRFRRYVQVIGNSKVYFKEFGDPRSLNYETGDFETRGKRVREAKKATEILHFRQHSEDPYGVPRWIAQLPAILGSRESEEVNLKYFEDNTIPPAIMSISGGRLTAESFRELKRILQDEGLGRDRQNKILLIEAVAETSGIDDKGNVRVQIDKLADSRQGDGLFKDYDEANQMKIRSAFRLPPVILGQSQDTTFATANVSALLAESQVFAPERRILDERINKLLINHPQGLGLTSVRMESKGPSITDPEAVIKSLTALNVMGAITPREAQETANEALQLKIDPYPEQGEEGYDEWMDAPIAFALRNTRKDEKTHLEQGQKTQKVKDTEKEGDVSFDRPEHGQE